MSNILITTGGTGGHIYPACSIAKELVKQGHNVIFVGSLTRMEKDIVPELGYKFYGLDIVPIKSFKGILKLFSSFISCIKIIRNENIDTVIGFGNYISLPSLFAGKLLFKKIYLQEQNVTMGQANKLMKPFADKIFLSFSETLNKIKNKEKFKVTGTPLREEFYSITKEKARKALNISMDKKVLCVMGGSLGAKNINEAIYKKLEEFKKENILVLWSTGKELFKEYEERVENSENIRIFPYFEKSYEIMAASDLILCRAGASTISEIIQLNLPSILIPYDFVGQRENAEVLEIADATKIYTNENISSAVCDAIRLITNDERLNFMSRNIKKINPGNAILNILKYFEK